MYCKGFTAFGLKQKALYVYGFSHRTSKVQDIFRGIFWTVRFDNLYQTQVRRLCEESFCLSIMMVMVSVRTKSTIHKQNHEMCLRPDDTYMSSWYMKNDFFMNIF